MTIPGSNGHPGITLLGLSGVTKPSPLLETFTSPSLVKTVEMTSDEVTALCPVTTQPDQYTVTIKYVPNKLCIESKSLKLKLQSIRTEGTFCENLSTELAEHIIDSIDPFEVLVEVKQKPRGGVSIISTSTYVRVPELPGVYKITNLANHKIYVGSTGSEGGFRKRWYDHRNTLRKGKHQNKYLQRAWNKYGETAFHFEVVEIITDSTMLLKREEYWIGELKSHVREAGYNICRYPTQGTLGLRWNHTEETKKKISESLTGKKTGPRSQAARERMRQAQPNRKYRRSEESKRQQSLRQTGKKLGPASEETKEKISKANKGKTKGIPKSEEHRKKIGAALRGKPKSEQAKANMRKPKSKKP